MEPVLSNISLTLKSPNKSTKIDIDENSNVNELRELAAKSYATDSSSVVLIFSGKIMKDGEKLSVHKVGNNCVIHVVIKTNKKPEPAAQIHNPLPTATDNTPSNSLLGNQARNLVSGSNIQEQANRIMNNPDMVSQLMNSPFFQGIMNNPELFRETILNNPQIRQLADRNPEFSHLLNNPDILRQTMEIARNPAMMQEMMRNQDRAISNLESIPGGFSALQRLYQDFQEPLSNITSDNPFASLSRNDSSGSNNTQVRQINNDPIPNPWNSNQPEQASGPDGNYQNVLNLLTNALNQQRTLGSNSTVPSASNNSSTGSVTDTLLNPSNMQAFSDPQVIEAVLQINRGFQVIQERAPHLLTMGFPGLSLNRPMNNPVATATQSLPPAEVYASQLEQLHLMGFVDDTANCQALVATHGDIIAAIDILLMRRENITL